MTGRLRRWLVLGALAGLASCAPSMRLGAGRQVAGTPRYADAPFVEPVEAPPDEVEADDGLVRGGRRRREPVFGDEPVKTPEAPPIRGPVTPLPPGPMDQIIAGATIQREYPGFQEHHLFPRQRELRRQFEIVGINVDSWTILVDPKQHAAAHGDRKACGPGGRWNREWSNWWKGPNDHTFGGAFAQALKMIASYGLKPYGLLSPYGCGRTIAHDLYDIVEPPR